jgi:secondary thiamine-phosphate synthase enzyme
MMPMFVNIQYKFNIKTTSTFSNITSQIKKFIKKSKLDNGIVTVFSQHTTTGIRMLEEERLLIEDFENFMERFVSSEVTYKHDNIEIRNVPDHERINAYSHLRSFYSNSSETIPVRGGLLQIGPWQSVIFIDFDKKRNRGILVTLMGERKEK